MLRSITSSARRLVRRLDAFPGRPVPNGNVFRIAYDHISAEVARRSEALAYAAALAEATGPKRAEALRKVVERIVCHFRYTPGKSFLDSLEIYAVSGDKVCFTNGIKPGPNSLRKALYPVYTLEEIESIGSQSKS